MPFIGQRKDEGDQWEDGKQDDSPPRQPAFFPCVLQGDDQPNHAGDTVTQNLDLCPEDLRIQGCADEAQPVPDDEDQRENHQVQECLHPGEQNDCAGRKQAALQQ